MRITPSIPLDLYTLSPEGASRPVSTPGAEQIEPISLPSSESWFAHPRSASAATIRKFKKDIETCSIPGVSLAHTRISDKNLSLLAGLDSISVLDLESCSSLTEGCLETILSFPKLEHLNLRLCDELGASTPAAIATMANLRYLDLSLNDWISAHSLEPLSQLNHLERLLLICCKKLGDDGLPVIAEITSLKALDLSTCPVEGTALGELGKLPSLEELRLSRTRLSKQGFEQLGTLTSGIRKLALDVTAADDAVIASLLKLEGLEWLSLASCSGLTTLQGLDRLEHLHSLDLGFCENLTDGCLDALTGMKSLRHLSLTSCTGLTEVGLQKLGQLSGLLHLDVKGCPAFSVELNKEFRNRVPQATVLSGA